MGWGLVRVCEKWVRCESEGWVWGVFEDVLVSVKCRQAHAQ